jgi:peptide/nickel transport system permease protein
MVEGRGVMSERDRLPKGRYVAIRVRTRRTLEVLAGVMRNPATLAGVVLITLIFLMALFAPLLVDRNLPNPYQMPRDWSALNKPPGTPGHILGTTTTGGDVLYGIVWGSRLSLRLALTVTTLVVAIGVTVGSIAGFVGGWVDEVLMRICDVFFSIPSLVLALAIAGALGPKFSNIILALVAVHWAQFARVMRAQIINVKGNEYVDAARVGGDSPWRVYFREILPNSVTPIGVLATFEMGKVVLVGATLSFLGLAEAGLAEWGNLVSDGQTGVLSGQWWVATFAGLMIFLWALSFNLVGDGLRDVLDPRTEQR